MFKRYLTERNICLVSALTMLALLLAGCGGANTNTATVNNSIPNNTPTTVSGGNAATATLKHQPVGTANLTWDHTDHMLTVQLMLSGLAPNSIHPVHVDQGSCSDSANSGNHDKTLYPLVNITADAHGAVNATSKVSVPNGIPARGWYVKIHNGPGVANSDQAQSIACGDITNQDTSLRSTQSAQVTFQGTKSGNQDANGVAHLSLSGHTLTVKLTITGLAPQSEHMVHIHAGTCTSQGAVVYPLTPIKADASGKATTTTVIQDVMTIPANGWYINVHYSTDLSTQTGFDPISCGNVVISKA